MSLPLSDFQACRIFFKLCTDMIKGARVVIFPCKSKSINFKLEENRQNKSRLNVGLGVQE